VLRILRSKTPSPVDHRLVCGRCPSCFSDVTNCSGPYKFSSSLRNTQKNSLLKLLLGVPSLDYDNDGWLDGLFVNGSTHRGIQRR